MTPVTVLLHWKLLFFTVAFSTLSSAIHSCSDIVSYDGFSGITVFPTTAIHANFLTSLLSNPCDAFLIHPDEIQRNGKNIIVIANSKLAIWTKVFPVASYAVITDDLATLLKSASVQKATYFDGTPNQSRAGGGTLGDGSPMMNFKQYDKVAQQNVVDDKFYRNYHTFNILEKKWAKLTKQYSANVRSEVIGKSHQNRSIYALYVGQTDSQNPRRILINSLLHAREWITVSATTYAIEKLAVELANSNEPYVSLLKVVQFIFVPVANPDGYVITASVDRFWRKNVSPGSKCKGVDLNRNWDLDFGGPHSTSVFECDDVYIGSFAFSEPETRALRDLFLDNPGIIIHLDVHSYSQIVIGPWSYSEKVPSNVDIVKRLGNGIVDDLSMHNGVQYQFSLHSDQSFIYLASGTMSDWTFARNVFSFGFELRPSRDDADMFLLPENEILPTCKEVFASLQKLAYFARDGVVTNMSTSPSPSRSADSSYTPDQANPVEDLSQGILIAICVGAAVLLIVLVVVAIVIVRSCRS